MSPTLKQAITLFAVLLVTTVVAVPEVSAKDEAKHIVPMAVSIECFIAAGQEQCFTSSPAIPAGKVFVIETISGSAERNSTGNLSAFVALTTGGRVISLPIAWINQG